MVTILRKGTFVHYFSLKREALVTLHAGTVDKDWDPNRYLFQSAITFIFALGWSWNLK